MGTNNVYATEEDADDESLKAGLAARIKRRGGFPPPFQASNAFANVHAVRDTTVCQSVIEQFQRKLLRGWIGDSRRWS